MSNSPQTRPSSGPDRLVWPVILTLTLVVVALVVATRWVPRPATIPGWAVGLPRLNAVLNSLCSVLLVGSYLAIRQGLVGLHKRLNLTAFALSILFLLSYVLFHTVAPETRFPAGDPLRPVYLVLLISHILLAMVVLPVVLMTFWLALRGRPDSHRRLARWTMPVWLYVTITGVVVYVLISPHYPF